MRDEPRHEKQQRQCEAGERDAVITRRLPLINEDGRGEQQVHRRHEHGRDVTVEADPEQHRSGEHRPQPPVLEIGNDTQQPAEQKRQRIQVIERVTAEDEMRGRQREHRRGHDRERCRLEYAPGDEEHQHDVGQPDDDGRQPDARLGERQHLQNQGNRVEDDGHEPARTRLPAHLDLEVQRHERPMNVPPGRRHRVRVHRDNRFVGRQVDGRVPQVPRVQDHGRGQQQHEQRRARPPAHHLPASSDCAINSSTAGVMATAAARIPSPP